MKFGDLDLFSLSDGFFALDGGAMFGVVPRVFWQKTNPPDERNRISLALRPLLIKTPQVLVLVDTGIGDKQDRTFQEIYRVEHKTHLADSLKQIGFAPADVSIVVNTHLHFDHCGGNTVWENSEPPADADNRRPIGGQHPAAGPQSPAKALPAFPNARYVVQDTEWRMATNPDQRSRASYLPENFLPVQESGQLELVTGEKEILPGVRVMHTAGHTGGHQIAIAESQGRTTVYWGDLIPTVSHLSIPYVMGYDTMPLVTMEMKEKFLKQALDEQWLMFFEHDPSIKCGYLAMVKDRYVVKETIDDY